VLLIEVRTGFTQRLRRIGRGSVGHTDKSSSILSRYIQAPVHFYPIYFSGPHGRTVHVDEYGTVLLVASDMGIASQLPYLAQLIRNYNNGRSCTRRVYLVWELSHWTKQHPGAIEIANRLLNEDIQDRAYVSLHVCSDGLSS
jgi:NAD(P)H-flavin reductase